MPELFVGTDGRERAQEVDLHGRSLQQQRPVWLASCNVWVASSFRGGLCENTDIIRTCLLSLPQ